MADVFINWGDSSGQTITLTGSIVPISHTYAGMTRYVIDISGRTTAISGMTLSGSNITELSGFSDIRVNIDSLNLNNNNFTVLPVINSKLKHLYLNESISSATSSVPNYSGSTLETLYVDNNNISTYIPNTLPDTMHIFSAEDNNINDSGVTNIINDMYNNASSKSGMTILLRNNGVLTGVTQKYDLIDNSGATVRTTGRFGVEIKRSDSYESGKTFDILISRPISDKNSNFYVDYGDGFTQNIVLSGDTPYYNFPLIQRLYSSGSSSETYYPKIDGCFDDITSLVINRFFNFSPGSILDIREFSNLITLNLPYYADYEYPPGIWHYHGNWIGSLNLSRNNKLEYLTSTNQYWTSLVWPNDVSHIRNISLNSNYNMTGLAPRIDLMPDLQYIDMSSCSQISGLLYNPNATKKITQYSFAYCNNLTTGAIPDFTDCTGLTSVNLSYSNRTSNGNTDWSTTSIYQLNLDSNYGLTGSVIDLDSAENLQYVNINSTGYETFGSSNWNTLPSLVSLYMYGNNTLSDNIPSLTQSTNLNTIQMSSNKLYGQIPDLSIFTGLTYFVIGGNKLSKELPDFSSNTLINQINLSDNKFNDWGGNQVRYGIFDIKVISSKILVAGLFSSYSGQTSVNLIRLNSGGTIDCKFDEYDKFDVGQYYEHFKSIDIQSDGKIIAVGQFEYVSGQTYNNIVRFNTDGTIDTGFTIGTGFNNYAICVKVQSDDKILVGGAFSSFNGHTSNYFIRLNSGGTIDTSFDIGVGFNSYVEVIETTTSGKILVGGGFSQYSGETHTCFICLNNDGSVDNSFTIPLSCDGGVMTITIQNDNKILLGGHFQNYNSESHEHIIRLNSDGTIDNSFVSEDGFNQFVYDIKVQNDGKIVAGGYFTTYSGQTSNYIIRLNSDGTIDTSFDTSNGFENKVSNNSYSYVKKIYIQDDGKILATGLFYSYSGQTANKLIRLNSDGTIDTSFEIGSNRALPDFSNNNNLSYLNIDYCGVNTWGDGFSGLTSLNTLYCGYNDFIHFPDFSNLSSLNNLYMQRNAIIDDLSMCNLRDNISVINLESNKISSEFPLSWSGFTNLTQLNLDYNDIYGILPSYFSGFTSLSAFRATDCHITGDITPICHPNLSYLDVQYNNFTSGVTSLSGSTNLSTITLTNNNFSGSTFFDVSNFNQLQNLYIQNCNLSGTLSPLPYNNYYIWYVDVSYNWFTGNIPAIPKVIYYNYAYYAQNNAFSGYTSMNESDSPNEYLGQIYFNNNNLSDTEINKVLADVVKTPRTGGNSNLYIQGPNMGTPTGQGLIDLNTLLYTKNWTVTYNIPQFYSGDTIIVDSISNYLYFIVNLDSTQTAIVNVSGTSYTLSNSLGMFVWDFGGSGQEVFNYTYSIIRSLNGTNFDIWFKYSGGNGQFYIEINKSS